MEIGKQLRLRRIFKEGRALIVPMDHAIFFGPVEGLEDMAALTATLAASGADGVLVTPGTLADIAGVAGDLAVLLRLDGTVSRLGEAPTRTRLIRSVEEAVCLGVDAVVLNIYPGAANEDELLEKLADTAEQCRRYGMPLIGEMIPSLLLAEHYGYGHSPLSPEERAECIGVAARVGAEIGVDALKINYSGTPESFSRVMAGLHRPVLLAGGVKQDSLRDYCGQVRDALGVGAAGVCVGRNIWQRENVQGVLGAIHALVHEEVALDELLEGLE